jgi:hypothetical protein
VNFIDHVFPHIHIETKNAQPVLERHGCSLRDAIDLCGGIPTSYITNIRVKIHSTYSTALCVQVVTDQYEVARNMDFEIGRIDNNYMYVEQKGQGIGTSLFLTQIRTARKFNFKKIHVTAMGPEDGLDWRGYYFWANLGFENTDIKEYKAWAAEMDRKEPTLSELVQTKAGRELWKNTGFTWIGNFHLAKDHPCSDYLQKYLKRKNLNFDLEN